MFNPNPYQFSNFVILIECYCVSPHFLVKCLVLPNSSGGSVILLTNGSVTTATYACDVGYTLTSNATRTCNQEGDWDSYEPICGNKDLRYLFRILVCQLFILCTVLKLRAIWFIIIFLF